MDEMDGNSITHISATRSRINKRKRADCLESIALHSGITLGSNKHKKLTPKFAGFVISENCANNYLKTNRDEGVLRMMQDRCIIDS